MTQPLLTHVETTSRSDAERLDGLQALLGERHTGFCACRWSTTGRGWRLHETGPSETTPIVFDSVRHAIDQFLDQNPEWETDGDVY